MLLAASSFAAELYPIVQVGTNLVAGQPSKLCVLVAGDIPISRDTAKNYMIFERAGYVTANNADDTTLQAMYAMTCGTRYFMLGKTRLDLILGTGFRHELIQGEDRTTTGLKLEAGAMIFSTVKLSIGADYWLKRGNDQVFLYAGLDLLPLL